MIPHGGFIQISNSPATYILIGGSNSNSSITEFRGVEFEIPHHCNMISITAVGAGGAGGRGAFGSGVGLGGGGGGGSGAIMSVTMPTLFLPSKIYAIPGIGGDGPTRTNGGPTLVVNVLERNKGGAGTIAYALGGECGFNGTTIAGGAGGAVSTTMANVQANGNAPEGTSFGVYNVREARNGAAGGFNSAGSDAPHLFVSGGTGGGALQNQTTQFNGGQVLVGLGGNGTGTQPDSSIYRTNPVSGVDIDGAHGIIRYSPLYFTGGIGGKSYISGNGGTGGNGAPGCGGGGSGAGGSGATGEADGGSGGDGFVIISVW